MIIFVYEVSIKEQPEAELCQAQFKLGLDKLAVSVTRKKVLPTFIEKCFKINFPVDQPCWISRVGSAVLDQPSS